MSLEQFTRPLPGTFCDEGRKTSRHVGGQSRLHNYFDGHGSSHHDSERAPRSGFTCKGVGCSAALEYTAGDDNTRGTGPIELEIGLGSVCGEWVAGVLATGALHKNQLGGSYVIDGVPERSAQLFRLFRVRELAGKGCSASEPHHRTRQAVQKMQASPFVTTANSKVQGKRYKATRKPPPPPNNGQLVIILVSPRQ